MNKPPTSSVVCVFWIVQRRNKKSCITTIAASPQGMTGNKKRSIATKWEILLWKYCTADTQKFSATGFCWLFKKAGIIKQTYPLFFLKIFWLQIFIWQKTTMVTTQSQLCQKLNLQRYVFLKAFTEFTSHKDFSCKQFYNPERWVNEQKILQSQVLSCLQYTTQRWEHLKSRISTSESWKKGMCLSYLF